MRQPCEESTAVDSTFPVTTHLFQSSLVKISVGPNNTGPIKLCLAPVRQSPPRTTQLKWLWRQVWLTQTRSSLFSTHDDAQAQ